MKGFKKLALVSAIAALPMSGFAMEALDDASLASVTGQDGVTIQVGAVAAFDIRVDDSDGITGADTGAIYIDNFAMTGTTTVDIDAGDGTGGAASDTLNVAVTLGAGSIDLGAISVTAIGATAPGATIVDMGTITHNGIDLNIMLGNEAGQGAMIVLDSVITAGINIAGLSIADASSGETISMDLGVTDNGGTDLTLDMDIDVVAAGLQIAPGGTQGAVDVTLGSLTLGSAPAIGDVTIIGLTLPTITISGH